MGCWTGLVELKKAGGIADTNLFHVHWLLPSLPVGLHHFCCGNWWCLLCVKLILSSFTPWDCAWTSLCPHSSVQLSLPECPDVTSLSSCGTQPSPWVSCYIHGWPDNNKEKYPRTGWQFPRKVQRSAMKMIKGLESLPSEKPGADQHPSSLKRGIEEDKRDL